jgi:serine/threonine-protein kinase
MAEDAPARLNAALEGRYAIERPLGEGGMAMVHLARDTRHEREVALEVLRPELSAVVGAERFLAEIRATANPRFGSRTLERRLP